MGHGIKKATARGKTYYYRRVGKDFVRLPDPEHPDFDEAYQLAAEHSVPFRDMRNPFFRDLPAFKRVLTACLYRARSRGREFDLDLDYILGLIAEAGGRCAVSGLAFDLSSRGGRRINPLRPSNRSDRLDQGIRPRQRPGRPCGSQCRDCRSWSGALREDLPCSGV